MMISRKRIRGAGVGGTSCRCIAGSLSVGGDIVDEEQAVATK